MKGTQLAREQGCIHLGRDSHPVEKYQNNHLAYYRNGSPDCREHGRCPGVRRNPSEERRGGGRRRREEAGGRRQGRSASSLVQVGPVVWALDVDPPHTLDPLPLPLFVLIQVVRAARCPAGGLQERIVRSSAVLGLVQQNIEGLLINPGLWELHLHSHNTQVRFVSITHCPPPLPPATSGRVTSSGPWDSF